MNVTLRIGFVVLVTFGLALGQASFGDDRPRDFGGRRHLERLSAELYTNANSLCWEMHRDYQNNRGYRKSYQKAYQLLQDSKHIRELAKGDRRYIRKDDEIERDLASSDRLFHELEREIADWHPDRHSDGDLPRLVDRYEDTLHHLMDDHGVTTKYDWRHAHRHNDRR